MLTKDQITAMQKANRIVVAYSEGQTEIRAIITKTVKEKGHEPQEVEFTTVINISHRFESYEKSRRRWEIQRVFFYLMQHGWHQGPIESFTRFLRPGDEITAEFIVANNNQYLEDAGLFRDSLRMLVNRGKKQYCFLLADSICKDNSARAIRYS